MIGRVLSGMAIAFATVAVGVAGATPIAHNEDERARYDGRVIPEAAKTTDYLQFGANESEPEARLAFEYLQKLYPQYVHLTTLAKELGDPNAVSTGPDGIQAGQPGDTGDGWPLYVIVMTDKRVPDRDKAYVSLMFAHSAETCGREGTLRSVEDFVKAAAEGSTETFTDGKGLVGQTHAFTAGEILKRTKTFVTLTSPDGWALGDGREQYSQDNGASKNSNRVAPQDGWSYHGEILDRNGYATATQVEGIAATEYLRRVRETELGGRPFAAGADMHGPIPSGTVLTHDQGNDPTKLLINQDFAKRVTEEMDAVLARYLGPGAAAYGQAGSIKDFLRENGFNYYQIPQAWLVPLEWVSYGGIWDQLGYTAGSTWGGWMNSDAGLDAPSVSYEINCVIGKPFDPGTMTLLIDNVRAVIRTTLVRATAPRTDGIARVDLGGPVGVYESGRRITDRDGNPSPPPPNFPNKPTLRQVQQVPYNVSQTDYLRDLGRDLLASPVIAITDAQLEDRLKRVATVVVADEVPSNTKALFDFVEAGGNLVLTDSALQLLPKFGVGTPEDIRQRIGYVGYADLDLTDPLTLGLPNTARQTYDPIGLGMQTLMERDAYYEESTDSGTKNSAPIWTIDKAALDASAGEGREVRTVATADPPADPKASTEGFNIDQATIGVVRSGAGQIVFFGGLLPRPVETNPHWYGLNAYTISFAGQTMLLRAMTHKRDGLLPLPQPEEVVVNRCGGSERVTVRVRKPRRGDRLKSVRATVDGRRVKVAQKRALRRRLVDLTLARVPDGTYKVKVLARTRRGRTIRVTRTFRTCLSRAVRSSRVTTAGAGARRASPSKPVHAPQAAGSGERDPFTGVIVG